MEIKSILDQAREGKIELTEDLKTHYAELIWNTQQNIVENRTRDLSGLPGLTHQGKRDNWEVFGYKAELTYDDYRLEYDRGLGGRIVSKWVDSTWGKPPKIHDAGDNGAEGNPEFEEQVNQFIKRFKLWEVLKKADIHASVGEFSIILIGFNDWEEDEEGNKILKNKLSTQMNKVFSDGLEDLLYLKVYSQRDISSIAIDGDTGSENYGKPKMYTISPKPVQSSSGTAISYETTEQIQVHYSRVIHVADKPLDNDFLGTPKMKRSFNVIQDILKTIGGSAEDYWRIGDRGMLLNVNSDVSLKDAQIKAIKEQIEEYVQGKRRFFTMQNTNIEQLGGRDVDPSGMFATLEKVLAATSDIPNRIFFGSERGQLASGQDAKEWAATIRSRQLSFGNDLIQSLINRLVETQILPPYVGESFEIGTKDKKSQYLWPNIMESLPVEESQIELNDATAKATKLQSFALARAEGMDPYNAAIYAGYTEEEALEWADQILNNPLAQ